MNTKQLLLSLLMSIMSVSAFAKDAIIDGIKYSLNDETLEAEVIEKNANKYSGDIIIPGTVNYMGKTYSVTSIGMWAFSNCKGLTSVTIPNSVTRIATYAFSGCSGLTSVTIGNSVTSIGKRAFGSCSGLTSITIPNSVTSIGNGAFWYCSGLTSITIPNSVTSIGNDAFNNCTGLTSVTIGNSVTSIGGGAFSHCSGLTSVTIPNSVTSIGDVAFYYCYGLESIIVENGNTIYDSRDNCNAIIETETNTLIAGCKNTVIPNSITSIGESAFCGCKGLTSVTIPNSVTTIGEGAFNNCTGLTSVTIGNSVSSIGDDAFAYCTGLTSVISLIEEPFEINENTFYDDWDWVEDHYEFTTAKLYVPAGTKSKYESTPAWNMFTNIVEGIENDVNSVETDAKAEETERYNIGGQRISSPQKGLNIVKMSDGTTRKVMCK